MDKFDPRTWLTYQVDALHHQPSKGSFTRLAKAATSVSGYC